MEGVTHLARFTEQKLVYERPSTPTSVLQSWNKQGSMSIDTCAAAEVIDTATRVREEIIFIGFVSGVEVV